MHLGIRIYRDGPCFVAAARRVETLFIPRLIRMDGFRGVSMMRFYDPTNGACGGLGVVAFNGGEQFTAAMDEAAHWTRHNLQDLLPALRPTELLLGEVLFADGTFC